jgi:hypothetical protein
MTPAADAAAAATAAGTDCRASLLLLLLSCCEEGGSISVLKANNALRIQQSEQHHALFVRV